MIWFIEDHNEYQIYITDLWREWYVPKFRIAMDVEEPYLYLHWNDREKGEGGNQRTLQMSYLDVVDGYGGYASNPSSAQELKEIIEEMIVSGFGGGGGGEPVLTDKGDLLTHDGVSDVIHPAGPDRSLVGYDSTSSDGLANYTPEDVVADVLSLDIIDALNDNAASPSSTNVFITEAELDAAIAGITVGGGHIIPENFADDNTTGTGANQTLQSLGYTNLTAAAVWTRVDANYPDPIDVTTMSLDFIIWQEMFYYMEEQGASYCKTLGTGKSYYISHTVYLPTIQSGVGSNRRSRIFLIDGKGCICRNSSGSDMILFDRYPDDQTEALNLFVAYSIKMQHFTLIGNSSATEDDILVRIGATLRPIFHDINVESCGIGIDAQFWLEAAFRDLTYADYGKYGIRAINGQWTGATGSNAQSNIIKFENLRFYNSPGNTPDAEIYCNGGYNIVGELLTFEGDNGSVHHFHYENTGTTPTDVVKLRDIYFETAGASRAGIRFQSPRGQFFVEKWHNRVNNTDMPVIIEADNNYDPTNSIHIFITGQAMDSISSKFRAVGDPNYPSIWHVDDVNMNDNSQLNVAANFETGVVTDSYIPLDQYTEFNTKADGTSITGDGTYSRPLTVNPAFMAAQIALA